MSSTDPGEERDHYVDEAVHGRRAPAVGLALDLFDRGASAERIVVELLAAAQHEVGERWYRSEITIADEHLATGITVAALAALASETKAATGTGHTVVCCAPGDWHSLASEMVGESLRAHGVTVTMLGASPSTEQVREVLDRTGADSLAVSCSLPLFYLGVRDVVSAAHGAGVPVIVGGRAMGTDAERGRRLGADGWAASVSEAVAILASWHDDRPMVRVDPPSIEPAVLRLAASSEPVAAIAFDDLVDGYPPMASFDERQLAYTREDLRFLAQFVAAARMVGDDTVLLDLLDWLDDLLTSRHVPRGAVEHGLVGLRRPIGEIDSGALRLVDAGLAHLRARRR